MENCTSGIYAWAGPGTVRLLKTKYHGPAIDSNSFLHLYDRQALQRAKDVFQCSDIWVSYSWGFSDSTEVEDRAFSVSKIALMREMGFRVHLYVQGLNVVSREFASQDLSCRDPSGRVLPYSRGRQLICPNNPAVKNLLTERVRAASAEDADGVFVDNILFGFPPAFIRSDFAPFFGCACSYCKTEFEKQFGYPLSFPIIGTKQLKDYLEFRSKATSSLVAKLSAIARSAQKCFGINLYDPIQMNSKIYFGYSLPKIEKHLDYLLIENHSLPTGGRSNAHLASLIGRYRKPVIVVSYDKGIGNEDEFTQSEYDHIASEGNQLGYNPCFKISEFTTNGVWHTKNLTNLHRVKTDLLLTSSVEQTGDSLPTHQWYDGILASLIASVGIPLVTLYFENPFFNRIGYVFYRHSIHSWKNFEI